MPGSPGTHLNFPNSKSTFNVWKAAAMKFDVFVVSTNISEVSLVSQSLNACLWMSSYHFSFNFFLHKHSNVEHYDSLFWNILVPPKNVSNIFLRIENYVSSSLENRNFTKSDQNLC